MVFLLAFACLYCTMALEERQKNLKKAPRKRRFFILPVVNYTIKCNNLGK